MNQHHNRLERLGELLVWIACVGPILWISWSIYAVFLWRTTQHRPIKAILWNSLSMDLLTTSPLASIHSTRVSRWLHSSDWPHSGCWSPEVSYSFADMAQTTFDLLHVRRRYALTFRNPNKPPMFIHSSSSGSAKTLRRQNAPSSTARFVALLKSLILSMAMSELLPRQNIAALPITRSTLPPPCTSNRSRIMSITRPNARITQDLWPPARPSGSASSFTISLPSTDSMPDPVMNSLCPVSCSFFAILCDSLRLLRLCVETLTQSRRARGES
jgi:hypothetical protein